MTTLAVATLNLRNLADRSPGCLDYIWVRGPIATESCRVVFDRPAVGDPTLYPSDHFGLIARLRLGA